MNRTIQRSWLRRAAAGCWTGRRQDDSSGIRPRRRTIRAGSRSNKYSPKSRNQPGNTRLNSLNIGYIRRIEAIAGHTKGVHPLKDGPLFLAYQAVRGQSLGDLGGRSARPAPRGEEHHRAQQHQHNAPDEAVLYHLSNDRFTCRGKRNRPPTE